MSNTIVQTTNPGWYINAKDPDGPRVRKKDGDTIISLEEFRDRKNPPAQTNGHQSNRTASQERAAHAARQVPASREARQSNKHPQQTDAEKSVPTTTSETGKTLRGKTTTIKCKFKEGSGPACGKQRVIKVQDAFQVKFCVEHQAAHRRQVKREKLHKKRQAAKAAAGK